MKSLYTTTVDVTGGRDGRAVAQDDRLAVDLAFPQTLGGSGNGTNPEQLFAAGFGACFTSSLAFAARGLNVATGPIAVDATVTLTVDDAGAYGISAHLAVQLPDAAPDDALRVIEEAKRICAYSNALKGKAEVDIQRP